VAQPEARRVILGRVIGPHGVDGWVKVLSYTEPRENILAFASWQLCSDDRWRAFSLSEGRAHGGRVLAKLEDVGDRDAAAALAGAEIAVTRSELPAAKEGEYYWSDLEGLRVRDLAGRELGRVAYLFATGANDVMVVRGERERLLPFVQGTVVREVDLTNGEIRVDWDAEF
jgi:16S rRNA processing protein RimM